PLFAQAPVPQAAELPAAVTRVLRGHSLPAESFALQVQEVGSAEPLLQHNADLPLNPASTIKLLTTFAALDSLGPAHVWQTELYTLGPIDNGVLQGDLLLRGSGDPFLVEDQ